LRMKKNQNIVYHGSKYDFDYFNKHMIGEGEGASGFGHGFYFSANKDDAKSYAEKLETVRGEARLYKVRIPNKDFFLNLDVGFDEQTKFVQDALMKISDERKEDILLNHGINFQKYKDEFDKNLEEYDLEFESPEYFEWLKDSLNTDFQSLGRGFFNSIDASAGGEYEASKLLQKLGIKGNMSTDFGHQHYVVFDEDDIEILSKTKPRF
jgi:hypothetical protein